MAKKKFSDLLAKMSPEAQAEIAARVKESLANMALDELREARQMTQVSLAEILGINQAAVSKMEHRTDMYIGTLARFVEAMGGTLEIRAHFPDGDVRINQFANIAKGAEA
jgi:predicted XRE-type DNA-binding protein